MKEFNYKINGTPYRVIVNKAEGNTIELEVNGTPFTVELEQKTNPLTGIKRPNPEAAPAPTPKSASTPLVTRPAEEQTKSTAIQSPLPGVILDIRCKEGDIVKKGQTLMVLEAMKMENNILANANGKITQILVQKGDSVLEGAELVVIE
ncbi:MAG TPA: acetyl-CoA carboxylase biotin carboxyl carrier protein subunit [Dysgonamonadaceae bacterium]|jgi:biotin carboxyl carrier protein|nr:acetyl-CoA carboxylase biotin carboxyl carrier protein subunit [Dysgonamonadaceae bacterium]HQG08062.1 acetyl-CoA carboxylase biotin carboxyl carrier protein subunit [Dysgonamonadaceae bacterium]HQI42962.1 acetyl-CoA carboxylase biotin carboxyl carrier protein subunit [Dysgonamonadaceae bacterium]